VVIVAILAATLAHVAAGTGPGRAPTPATANSAWLWRAVNVSLPAGRTNHAFTINAPAHHAYDVTLAAPVGSAIVLTMNIATGTGWTITTRHDPGCSTSATGTACVSHFAAGGNPGGTWKAVVRKTSAPAVNVRLTIIFRPRAATP